VVINTHLFLMAIHQSSVTNMGHMFYNSTFNGNISGWCVQSVTAYTNFNTQSVLSGANLPPFGTTTNCN